MVFFSIEHVIYVWRILECAWVKGISTKIYVIIILNRAIEMVNMTQSIN